MDGRNRIAWNLRRLRSLRGVTQEDLAVDAQVNRTSISGIENQTVSASIDLLERLADALAIDLVELVQKPEVGEESPQNLKPGRKPK
ncbi:MAG: transcriptional regulator, family [Devosia sp.]|uniref:helix-turn-helix domain-containing protein n=1 Tax=Devosia sp. TaxID=1871048 RepID=UPI002614F4EC|nr:helix-turn-helix transcriptional regulator [Devosia sp.]MDB5528118.1 transcriptional regulator, family [Devosia sp.]